MKLAPRSSKHRTGRRTLGAGATLAAAGLVVAALVAPAAADEARRLGDSVKLRSAAGDPHTQARLDALASDPAAAELAETWGIQVTSIRLTAHGHMIDYRYRVLDAAKAEQLFERQIKPRLIHNDTGRVLAVPDTAKVGPLRNSNTPQNGKVYWMFFGNAEHLVQPGDSVTVVIGDCRVENLQVG